MDVTRDELDGPARLRFCKMSEGLLKPEDWEGARQFPSLREALHVAANEEAPPGTEAFIVTNAGRTLKPEQLAVTWDAMQGP
ncbi:hypothetical protein GCM10007036_23100 [Alsobacter metallidurans]|uniref:Uncharacterized protein n=1 Tax=Alsobacter metallidurans TaxID=340221 RepID=A0A917I7P2_9HYPH|nr:hypothetical protein [Alsobacter metallidurans]GGH19895.1 hypothetical protein GCM10007036_23100 [Alsobacter metallidurans]